MKIKWKLKLLIEIFVFVFLIFLDQITKYLAVINLKGQDSIVVIKNILDLTYLENRGAAFGILQDKIILFAILTIVVLGAIIYFKIKIDKLVYKPIISNKIRKKYLFLNAVLILLLTGAIGNFIDRLRMNYVVDFLRFKFIDFPVFNVADMLVVVSSVLLMLILIFVFKSSEFEYLNNSKESNDKQ